MLGVVWADEFKEKMKEAFSAYDERLAPVKKKWKTSQEAMQELQDPKVLIEIFENTAEGDANRKAIDQLLSNSMMRLRLLEIMSDTVAIVAKSYQNDGVKAKTVDAIRLVMSTYRELDPIVTGADEVEKLYVLKGVKLEYREVMESFLENARNTIKMYHQFTPTVAKLLDIVAPPIEKNK